MKAHVICSGPPSDIKCRVTRIEHNSYPSKGGGGHDPRGSSGGQGHSVSHSSAQSIARIASDKDFAATCHGSIAVDSLISHTVAQNAAGKGINAVASLQVINLGFNNLNDSDILKLNNGLLGYTLNLKVLHLNNNNFSNTGLDYLIKGPAGIQYLQAGGADKPFIMQGLFTHYNVNMTQINLSNNQLTDVGAGIISHALVTGSLPHLKALDVSGNQITPTGYGYFVGALDSRPTQNIAITLEEKKDKNAVWEFVTKGLKYAIEQHYKSQQLSEDAILAIYGDGDLGTCKVALKNAALGVSAGIVSKLLYPSTSALIKNAPGWQGKALVGVGIFISAFKDALKSGDIVNPDLFKCIGAVNRHLGVGFNENGEIKNMGDFYDIDNFLDGN